jgi:uncharacterized protein
MDERYRSLLELQELDKQIVAAEARRVGFGPELAEIVAPVTTLEQEIEAARSQLSTLQGKAGRLERGAQEKRDRLKRYEERLERVRNAREEAAARTELSLVRRAAEADEDEALEVHDQVMRLHVKLDEMQKKLTTLKAQVEPRRREVEQKQQEIEHDLAVLRDRRANHALRLDPQAARLYERVRSGRSRTVLAPLMPDGACGNCFGIVPVQERSEIKLGRELSRCEACGVILYTED